MVAFLTVLLLGMTGYRFLVEGTSWFDGLYMTFLTVTTIGFSEVVNLEGNDLGRAFTILIALLGIGVLTYAFSNLAALIIESNFTKHMKQWRMEQAIQKLKDHYLICGGSSVGMHVAEELERTHRPFVLGDLDEALVEKLQDRYQYGKVLLGDCTHEDFLIRMGIKEARGVFVTTRNDHNNIVISLTSRQVRPDISLVAHCKDPENHRKLSAVGVNRVISPSFIGGLRMASEMVRPNVTNFLDLMLRDTNRNLRIEEVTIPAQYDQQKLTDLPLQSFDQTLVLAIKQADTWDYNPPADYKIQEGSHLIVMTSPEDLKNLTARLNQ